MKWQELCAHSDALTQNLGKWLASMALWPATNVWHVLYLRNWTLKFTHTINDCIKNKIITHGYLARDARFALYIVTLCKHIRYTMLWYLLTLSYKLFVCMIKWQKVRKLCIKGKDDSRLWSILALFIHQMCVHLPATRNNMDRNNETAR